jgi:hypothetical protein
MTLVRSKNASSIEMGCTSGVKERTTSKTCLETSPYFPWRPFTMIACGHSRSA